MLTRWFGEAADAALLACWPPGARIASRPSAGRSVRRILRAIEGRPGGARSRTGECAMLMRRIVASPPVTCWIAEFHWAVAAYTDGLRSG